MPTAITVAGTLGRYYFTSYEFRCCGRPALRHLYVADLASGAILAQMIGDQHKIAVDESAGYLYVAMNDGVHVRDATTLAPVTTLSQPTASVALAADAATGRIYSMSDDDDIPVMVIDAATNTEVASLPGDDYGFGIAVENGCEAVSSWRRWCADTAGRLDVFVADALVGSVPLGTQPRAVAARAANGDEWIGDDIDGTITVVAGIDAESGSGTGLVTTDPEADGATAADPVETTVASPVAGPVTISEGGIGTTPPNGYSLFGMQVDISAPSATSALPWSCASL